MKVKHISSYFRSWVSGDKVYVVEETQLRKDGVYYKIVDEYGDHEFYPAKEFTCVERSFAMNITLTIAKRIGIGLAVMVSILGGIYGVCVFFYQAWIFLARLAVWHSYVEQPGLLWESWWFFLVVIVVLLYAAYSIGEQLKA